MKLFLKLLATTAILATLAGCVKTAPVEQINTVVTAGHTEEQVRSAILKAGVQRQWIMTAVSPGVIKGRLIARDHNVDIRVNYTATSYSIHYENSVNMQASGGKIHKNYNRWVRNLDKDIQINLSSGAKL